MSMDSYTSDIETWRQARLARLKSESGWLNIIGRWELPAGRITFGSAGDNDIVLGIGPAHVGALARNGDGSVTYTPADTGTPQVLRPDDDHYPEFSAGRLLAQVTALGSRLALRIRDREAPGRTALNAIPHYPVDPSWRIVADWVRLAEPQRMSVDTVIGVAQAVTVTHKAVFSHGSAPVELMVTHGTPDAPHIVFRDATAGETWPGARFLFPVPEGDRIVLDFNKAVNPPSSLTPYATCPLPPPQNVLGFRIEAGELRVPGMPICLGAGAA